MRHRSCVSGHASSIRLLLSSSFSVALFSGLIGVPPASCRQACRFRYKCRTDGHRHRDPNGRVAVNSAAYDVVCFVGKPAIHLPASPAPMDATWPVFARVSALRAGQSRHGRAKPGGRARCVHTRPRAAVGGRHASGEFRRTASGQKRVGSGKAPHGPWRAVGAHNGPHERKAFHLLCRDRRSRSFLSSGYDLLIDRGGRRCR